MFVQWVVFTWLDNQVFNIFWSLLLWSLRRLNLLEGLEESEVPIETRTKSFSITIPGSASKDTHEVSVQRRQLPITPAYAFTDYQSQGQTLGTVIVAL